jgi:putative methionine-R-sulfoxide reductase with GAF domain
MVSQSTRAGNRPLDDDLLHEFPGHIACDSASNSEIVVPIIRDGIVLGVLDVDSPEKARFDETDMTRLERLVETLLPLWPRGENAR